MTTALYSQPPLVTHGPLLPWTLRIAVTIVAVRPAPASGVSAPRVMSAPPTVSAVPAAVAWRVPGLSPSDSKNPAVPSRPWPPNQPNSFCVPWPTKRGPMTPRRTREPSLMGASVEGRYGGVAASRGGPNARQAAGRSAAAPAARCTTASCTGGRAVYQ